MFGLAVLDSACVVGADKCPDGIIVGGYCVFLLGIDLVEIEES